MKAKRIVLVFFLWITWLNAQTPAPYFKTLTVADGLPEAYIRCKLEDTNGYLWFGTQNGLVRYDGYQLKRYPLRRKNGENIANPAVEWLYQDKRGKIWAWVNSEGIHALDPSTDQFVLTGAGEKIFAKTTSMMAIDKEPYVDPSNPDRVWFTMVDWSNLTFHAARFDTKAVEYKFVGTSGTGKHHLDIKVQRYVGQDHSGQIYLCGDNILYRLDSASDSFKPFFELPDSMAGFNIFSVRQDHQDKDILWLNTDMASQKGYYLSQSNIGGKIIRLNKQTKDFQTFTAGPDSPHGLLRPVSSITSDTQGRVWFMTPSSISSYDAKTERFTNYEFNVQATEFPLAYGVVSDQQGNIWFGGSFAALGFLNPNTGNLKMFVADDKEGGLPAMSQVDQLFYDRSGRLWAGIPMVGIAYIDRQKSMFSGRMPQQDGEDYKGFHILGKYSADVFLIRADETLYMWDVKTDRKTPLNVPSNPNLINQMATDADGNIWATEVSKGLVFHNPKTKTTKVFSHDPTNENSLSNNYVRNLCVDRDGMVWVTVQTQGINSYDPKTGKFTRYPFIQNDNSNMPGDHQLDDLFAVSIAADKSGRIWIGTNQGGLNRYDKKTGKFKSYLDRKLGFRCVLSIFEDSKNRIWAGTYMSGLFLVDPEKGPVKNYGESEGLSQNTVYAIAEDSDGHIWVSTLRGYSRINPKTGEIRQFGKSDKMHNNPWDSGFVINSDGQFYQTFSEGMVKFHPRDVKPNAVPPNIVIESIRYSRPNVKDDKELTLFYPGEKIELKHNQNKISFDFIALHFDDPLNNRYQYQLVGYDQNWIDAGFERSASYTNLSPGTYTFKVKAANSDGVWNEQPAEFTFTILPPWWKTWWAYLLYAVAFIGAVYWYTRYRSAKLTRENKVLEEKVALRTSQLEASITELKNTQAQLIQSEKMASLGELTAGIAHEIQNPLNFVNNFSDVSRELIEEVLVESQKSKDERDDELVQEILSDIDQNLEKINHHGKRADAIVKGMLQHSRSTSGEKEPTDLNALADEYLRLAYHGLRAKDKSFNAELVTNFDPDLPKVNVVPQDIGRVLLNLLTNAFYATQKRKQSDEDFKPVVELSTALKGISVEISVKDNGSGIPQDIIDKIFQPFFTTKPTGEGTGLGLSMSYDIIKAHGGSLKVDSTPGEGSVFLISLPLHS